MNKKLKCPCGGYYTIDSDDEIIVEICDVCLWQYDEDAHENPEKIIGANKISLKEAKNNINSLGYLKKYIGKNFNRKPCEDEIN